MQLTPTAGDGVSIPKSSSHFCGERGERGQVEWPMGSRRSQEPNARSEGWSIAMGGNREDIWAYNQPWLSQEDNWRFGGNEVEDVRKWLNDITIN